jgi:hypothetical protein
MDHHPTEGEMLRHMWAPMYRQEGAAAERARILKMLTEDSRVLEAACRAYIANDGEDPDRETTIADRPAGWMLMKEDALAVLRAAADAIEAADREGGGK